MPVDHVVLFDTKAGVEEAEVTRAIQALNGLPGLIPEIRSWSIREDIGRRDLSFRFVLAARFDDLAAVERYLAHPAHLAAVAIAGPLISRIAENDHTVEADRP